LDSLKNLISNEQKEKKVHELNDYIKDVKYSILTSTQNIFSALIKEEKELIESWKIQKYNNKIIFDILSEIMSTKKYLLS
jgi:hypothetical protein